MTVGRRDYNDAEMMRMQRDAEARVREMQNRARQTVEQDPGISPPLSQRNRNWSSNPNMQRRRQQQRPQQHPPQQKEEKTAPPAQDSAPPPTEPAVPVAEAGTKTTTIVEDVMNALGLDEDYILIIGLLLILINQRADTTLILALAYLLI